MKLLFRVVALAVVFSVFSGQAFGQDATPLPTEETNFTVWHPGGDMLLVTEDNIVRILDVTALENPIRTFQLEGRKLYTAPAWSPDGEMLALDNDSRLEIWDHPWEDSQTEPIAVLTFEEPNWGALSALTWSPDGQRIAAAGGPIIQIWDTTSWQLLYRADGGDIETDIAWSRSGNFVADALRAGYIGMINADTYELLIALLLDASVYPNGAFDHPTPASIAWAPDSIHLVIGADDGSLRVLDTTPTGEVIQSEDQRVSTFPVHQNSIEKVAWRPGSMELASGSRDGTIKVWDMETMELRETITIPRLGSLWSFGWSPDGTRIAYREPGNDVPTIVEVPPLDNGS